MLEALFERHNLIDSAKVKKKTNFLHFKFPLMKHRKITVILQKTNIPLNYNLRFKLERNTDCFVSFDFN